MAEPGVTRLLPGPVEDVPLKGLYLGEALHERRAPGRTLIYGNFVTSLDGRISVGADGGGPVKGVPTELANRRDWRLYQELAVQADVIVTTGRYVRDRAKGEAGPILAIEDDPAMSDLVGWRERNGLASLPAIAVVSRSLDFDEGEAATIAGDVIAIGSAAVTPGRVAQLEDRGISTVLGRSAGGVSGTEIAKGLADLGHHTAFSAAGPRLAHLLMDAQVLDVLYVTYVMTLLGGRSYLTLNEGDLFENPPTFEMRSLYLDPAREDDAAQLFAAFELQR